MNRGARRRSAGSTIEPDLTRQRAAIVGAGPSGFYAAGGLLKAGFEVDLYDALPTPYGLVRAGVAPDHPKIKSVTRVFDKTAALEGCRFFGGVALGRDISREDLLERYSAVLYAFGSTTDNRLGIAGEDRPGSHAAVEFVAWYNGHPDHADRTFDLRGGRAVVIGNGNVALDLARILLLDRAALARTDVADHALEELGRRGVQDVVVLGRRGPAEASFTNPEVKELGELLEDTDIVVDPEQLAGVPAPEDMTRRRNVEMLRGYAETGATGRRQRLELRFLRSPLEILGEGEDGPVTGVRLAVNRLETTDDGRVRAVPTGEEEVLECGLVLRSIGYRGEPLAGIPFDDRRGLVRNLGGRVCDDAGQPCPGEYVVGWIKRGPTGVIGTNKKDAADTVARVVEDREAGRLRTPDAAAEDVEAWLAEQAPHAVTWDGWEAIDRHECGAGEPYGRPRVKLVRVADMHDVAAGVRL
jgi:ferredoxin/flavodoxin---NADP+ reductase